MTIGIFSNLLRLRLERNLILLARNLVCPLYREIGKQIHTVVRNISAGRIQNHPNIVIKIYLSIDQRVCSVMMVWLFPNQTPISEIRILIVAKRLAVSE